MQILHSTRYPLQHIRYNNTKATGLTKIITNTTGISAQSLLFESIPPVFLIALKRHRVYFDSVLNEWVSERNPLELKYSENISIHSGWRTAGITTFVFCKFYTNNIIVQYIHFNRTYRIVLTSSCSST